MGKINTKFLILGGGLSGLFTALFFKLRGQDCIVIEKLDDVGGLARTYSFRGHSFDIGGHRIAFYDQKNIELLHSLVPELAILLRESKIYYNGNYINYPITPSSFQKFSKKQLLKIFFEIVFRNRFSKPHNFEEWIKKYYGETIYKIVFEHYSEKVWGRDCKDLCADWAKKRIGCYSLSNMFLNKRAKEGMRRFYYPKQGIGCLAQNIYKKLIPETRVFKNSTIQEIRLNNSCASSVVCTSPTEKVDISCKHLISTIPLTELLRFPPFTNNQTLQNLARNIKYRSLLQVNLLLKRELVSDWHWCYFPDENLIFSRCYEPKYWHHKMGQQKDSTLLCLEVFCDYNDIMWNMDEEVLVKRLCSQLVDIGLIGQHNECKDFSIVRERYAYPLPFLQYHIYVEKIVRELCSFKNLHLVGRSGTHAYFDIEECMISARALTQKLI